MPFIALFIVVLCNVLLFCNLRSIKKGGFCVIRYTLKKNGSWLAILLIFLFVVVYHIQQLGLFLIGEWWSLCYDVVVAIQVDDVFR